MALPSFRMHKKFLTLVARLQIPEVYVRGHMEYLWESANATGDPVFSDEAMVEAAASWNGGGHGGPRRTEFADLHRRR